MTAFASMLIARSRILLISQQRADDAGNYWILSTAGVDPKPSVVNVGFSDPESPDVVLDISRMSIRRYTKVRRNDFLKQPDQSRVHIRILIWNIKANHPLMFQVAPELLCELVAVCALHDEYQISPLQQFWRHLFARGLVQPSGCDLDTRPLGENLLCRGTA